MGIEHERIHLETSSVLIRQLDLKYVKKSELFIPCEIYKDNPQNELIAIGTQSVLMGKGCQDGDYYGWDNEYGTKEVFVQNFEVGKFLVSNGEFLEFVQSGGYANDEFWEEEGLAWLDFTKATFPSFWHQKGGLFYLRLIDREILLPLNWAVEVNYHEAKAFCNFKSIIDGKSYRLPSEAEWYALYNSEGASDDGSWGDVAPANINLEHFASPSPVDMFKFKNCFDVIGNVWQWSESAIDGFDGFKTHPTYDDFSIPTFDGRHNLIKGGSFISTGNEILKSARYAFRRHFYQHAGFRYALGFQQAQSNEEFYEKDLFTAKTCYEHFGKEHFGIKNYQAKCAKLAINACKNKKRALSVGCGVGRGAFELAKKFEFTQGIDITTRVIKIAQMIKNAQSVKYELFGNYEIAAQNYKDLSIEFWQQDPCNLKPIFKDYDLVLATNALDEVYNPKKFLQDIKERINFNGVLVLGLTYKNLSYIEIKNILEPEFREFKKTKNIKRVQRQNKREFLISSYEISFWKKLK
jgi:formylglycine-generating enzyme required for sulfatase activity/2-polyprenyl-3-methyl-5-hydroxy-6-metoxy-1,4-benzoquinol methylase